jgi:hypothetical protein
VFSSQNDGEMRDRSRMKVEIIVRKRVEQH